ncbi:hypothetical protein DFH06DRAFT_1319107 [Mycena polygramma]|nr:hypothetical protein DFH06DRAFT_1319107 [Mycena polygramma]
MHRSLQIPEIIETICDAAAEEHHQLAILARTSKSFDPALNVLWRNQNCITNLLRCMPDDLWDIKKTLDEDEPCVRTLDIRLRRSIAPSDWERPLRYMPRVRSFALHDTFETLDFFEALSWSLPGDAVFPNLQSLTWLPDHSHSASTLPPIRLFLSPRLRKLSLGAFYTFADFSIFANLALKCPTLRDFFLLYTGRLYMPIESTHPRDKATSHVSRFLCGLIDIQSVNVPDLDDMALAHLAQHPSLRRLSIRSERQTSFVFPQSEASLLFPALTSLTMCTMDRTVAFLTALGPRRCSLVDFALIESGIRPAKTDNARQFYSTLASHCSLSSLRKITVTASFWGNTISPNQAAAYALGTDIIAPLFLFSNLVSVSLAHPVGFDLDDATILPVIRAWPQITHLTLKAGPSRHIRSRVTLQTLSAFAQHCPVLVTLHLTLDASAVPAMKGNIGSGTAGVSRSRLKCLNVAASPVNHPRQVAKFLVALFPALGKIKTLWDETVPMLNDGELQNFSEPQIILSDSTWKLVAQALLALRK